MEIRCPYCFQVLAVPVPQPSLESAPGLAPLAGAGRTNGRAVVITSVVVAGLLLAYVAWPYLTAYGLWRAIVEKDTAAIASAVNFVTIRPSLKGQLEVLAKEEMDKKGGGQGSMGQLAAMMMGTMIDSFMDVYMTPEGIGLLAQSDPSKTKIGDAMKGVRYAFFRGASTFLIEREDSGLVFRLGAGGWKLVDVRLSQTALKRVMGGAGGRGGLRNGEIQPAKKGS